MKNQFKEKNQEVFKSLPSIVWFDEEGILDIDKNFYVSFRIDDIGTRNSYNCYHVDVYNKTSGVVKTKRFFFRDYLKINHIWKEGKNYDWYTVYDLISVSKPTPNELKTFVTEILLYLNMVIHCDTIDKLLKSLK